MLKKTAIAIEPSLLKAVDEAAQERGQSRNAFIGTVLARAIKARRDREITRQLDALFEDEDLKKSQRDDMERFDAQGSSWADERW